MESNCGYGQQKPLAELAFDAERDSVTLSVVEGCTISMPCFDSPPDVRRAGAQHDEIGGHVVRIKEVPPTAVVLTRTSLSLRILIYQGEAISDFIKSKYEIAASSGSCRTPRKDSVDLCIVQSESCRKRNYRKS